MWRFWSVFKAKRLLYSGLAVLCLVGVFLGGVATGNYRARSAKISGLPSDLKASGISDVYQLLRDNYDGTITSEQATDGMKHGLAAAANDPYTEYFTSKEAKEFNNQLQGGSFTGIGAQLEQDTAGNILVLAPLDGSPAMAAGVRAQDYILAVNGKATTGKNVNTVVNEIRGPKGSKVTLSLLRNKSQRIEITIVRDDIKVPTATSKILDGNIGYLQVSQFSDDTFGLVQQAVSKFQQANVKKVILDLRDDPGGEVKTAINISSLWLSANKLIMQEKRGSTVVNEYDATGNNPLLGMPTVVLLNAGSASASEITASALHDNGAATIIGVKSYGKGVVQQLLCVAGHADSTGNCPADVLKVTVASWYRPNGQNINKKGISPDKTVEMTDADYQNNRDPQLDAAKQFLANK